MFEDLKLSSTPEQKVRLYNSFVSGLFKYFHVEKAMIIIDEMKQNNLSLDITTYNYLLRSTSLIKESYETRWQFTIECLQDMKQNSIQPNLRTFNAILYTLRRSSLYDRAPTLTLSILNEMRANGIEPSLGTWAHVIMIFYPNDQIGYDTQILPQIMDELEKQYELNRNQFQWRDVDDGEFFFNAMFKATVNCRDVDLGKVIFGRMGSDGMTSVFRTMSRVRFDTHVGIIFA
jgi:pentatricopeptide repeat domain-containing protein 3